jgi:hypothetical protein
MKSSNVKTILKLTLVILLGAATFFLASSNHVEAQPEANPNADYVGNEACAKCHADIYKTYLQTPMANSSGLVNEDKLQAALSDTQFVHPASSVKYHINKNGADTFIEYERQGTFQGRRKLDFFIGSGNHGRSFLSAVEGFLYQSPVSYYAKDRKWEMSPGYETMDTMKLGRAIRKGCLECHASRLQPVGGTENQYAAQPFLDRGISCERCHGPGEQHIKLMKAGSKTTGIVNPSKLAALNRDSVCAQCHLSGEARIEKPGRSLLTFRPGDALSDHVLSFLSTSNSSAELKATGHVEKFWQSKCKQSSGEKLSCTTCHNPHETQPKAKAAAYFNPKCATCHQDNACKEDLKLRTTANNNCIGCHMPKSPTEHIGHNVFTNHAIPRRANVGDAAKTSELSLAPFWGQATTRDLGLAYLSLASRTKDANYLRATELLKKAEPTLKNDAYALTALAKMYERDKNNEAAVRCYELALQADPAQTEAAVNLGTLYARQSKLAEAVKLWEDVLKRNPGYEIARINLAVAHLENGNFETARKTLQKALEYDPDLPMVRKLLTDLEAMKK